MKTLKKFAIAGLAAAALSSVAFAGSHGGKLPASVKARQAHMQLNAHNVGVLFGMVKGEVEYNADLAKGAAGNLVALSGLNQMTYWESGTDSDSVDGSRALPALWENIPDAIAKGEALNAAAVTLAGAAGDGLDALKAGIGPVGKACGACHEDYQLSNN